MPKKSIVKIRDHAAGIDIGSERIFVGISGQEVKSFPTFTQSYHEAIVYLREHGITTVAMEATGIYWLSFYDMLEASGIEAYVINAADVKSLSRRKTDVADCQWLQELHAHGLLRSSFIPPDAIRRLRSYVRLRGEHVAMGAQHIQHMQKALERMNVKLHNVISKLNGVSGMRILKAIIAGEHNPDTLVTLLDCQIAAKKHAEVLASLHGNYREEHLFALRQAVECWEFYQQQILACDKAIEKLLSLITQPLPTPSLQSPAKPHQKLAVDHLHEMLMKMTGGKNPVAMAGLTDLSLLQLTAEIGTDLTAWPSEKHFVAWAGLAPNMQQSGKSTRRRNRKTVTRVGQIFRVAAQSVAKSKHLALGAFYRRVKARRGPYVAMKAVARKLAVIFYNIMTKGIHFVETGLQRYQERYQQHLLHNLEKQARKLGMTIQPAVVH